jgi:RNA polymerase sigma-70 factor (ECF subfamily)
MQAYAGFLVEAAYSEHRAALVRHLTQVTRDGEVAQDLAQEAFIRLAREVDAGRAPDDTAAWLHRVGLNLATSRGRHLQVVERRADRIPRPAVPESPDDVAIAGELGAAIALALAQLSGAERHALALAAHGFEGHEIASSIGRTPGATRTLLCRARAKVRATVAAVGASPA